MKTITIRDVVFGEGRPKICIPIMPHTLEEIPAILESLNGLPFDIIEWRMDHFSDIMNFDSMKKAIHALREGLQSTPLLATFRTHKEGGVMELSTEDYVALNKAVIDTKVADFVDIECFTGDSEVKNLVDHAHANGMYVIMSNHDFDKTPAKEEIVSRLCLMQEKNADIPKIALMPTCKKDVLTLLDATREMSEEHADRPIITMSMASDGIISRLAGEVFGSCLTFGAAGQASAPGQIGVKDLKTVLDILHKSL